MKLTLLTFLSVNVLLRSKIYWSTLIIQIKRYNSSILMKTSFVELKHISLLKTRLEKSQQSKNFNFSISFCLCRRLEFRRHISLDCLAVLFITIYAENNYVCTTRNGHVSEIEGHYSDKKNDVWAPSHRTFER